MKAVTRIAGSTALALLVGLSAVALAMDAVDGWLARRTNSASELGARFDMEVDALLVLVLVFELWLREQAGAWVLTGGLLRYVYTLSFALVEPRVLPVARSRFGRYSFGVVVLMLLASLIAPAPIGELVAAAGTLLVTLSYGRSFQMAYFPGTARQR